MQIELAKLGNIIDLAHDRVLRSTELASAVDHRRELFKNLTLGPERFVIVAHGGTPDFFADLFATWQAGACAVCINPNLTHRELLNVAEFVGPTVVLVDEDSTIDLRNISVPVLCTSREKPPGATQHHETADSTLDDPALILFTSGTTGTPKGVVHTFRSLFARIALNQTHIGRAVLARSLCVLPTHFGHGLIGNCLTPLFAHGDLLLHSGMGLAGAAKLSRLIVDHQISFMSSVPSFWRVALRASPAPPPGILKQVHIGSAPLSVELWRDVSTWTGTDNVVNMYGITETANWVSGASAQTFEPCDGLIGTMWGGSAAVATDDGRLAPEGEGELLLQTPALMTGYLKQPDLTKQVLRDGWYRTGDIGRIDDKQVIRLTGRIKDEINRSGMKIHPSEIDFLLERHPQVLEACTFGVPDKISGEIVGVAVRLADDSKTREEELRTWCSERIRAEGVPEKWFVLSEIPKTDRGKIRRSTVMEHCLNK